MLKLKVLAFLAPFVNAQCGTFEPPATLSAEAEMAIPRAENNGIRTARSSEVVIDTFIHVLHNGTTTEQGFLSEEQIEAQMNAINEAFAPYSFRFNLIEAQQIENEDWAYSQFRNEMKYQLHKGSYSDLNLYFVNRMGAVDGVTGECTFPNDPNIFIDPDLFQLRDGCLVVSHTVPGGSHPAYNLGLNAVHEIGHWLG
jgi:hypothetical protein